MGAGNVSLVFANWGELNHAPFRLLSHMALVSLDKDTPPRYFGGPDAMAHAMRGAATATDAVVYNRAWSAARSALLELMGDGVVERSVKAAPGRRAEYQLWLWPEQAAEAAARYAFAVQARSAANCADSSCKSVQGESTNGAGSSCKSVQGWSAAKEDAREAGTQDEENSVVRTTYGRAVGL